MSATFEFCSEDHSYWLDGLRLPSVTQILKPLVNFDGIAPDVLERKRLLGVDVHLATELFDRDELDQSQTAPIILGFVEAWCRFRNETGAVVVENEKRLYHPVLLVAGTIDRLLRMPDGSHTLCDLKTGEPSPVHGIQTAAYQLLLEANGGKVNSRATVHLRPDGTYRYHQYKDPSDKACFLALLNVWRWKINHPHASTKEPNDH